MQGAKTQFARKDVTAKTDSAGLRVNVVADLVSVDLAVRIASDCWVVSMAPVNSLTNAFARKAGRDFFARRQFVRKVVFQVRAPAPGLVSAVAGLDGLGRNASSVNQGRDASTVPAHSLGSVSAKKGGQVLSVTVQPAEVVAIPSKAFVR